MAPDLEEEWPRSAAPKEPDRGYLQHFLVEAARSRCREARLAKLPEQEIAYTDNAVLYSASGREASVSRDASGFGRSGVASRVKQPDAGVFRSVDEVTDDPARASRGFASYATLLAAYYAKTLAR